MVRRPTIFLLLAFVLPALPGCPVAGHALQATEEKSLVEIARESKHKKEQWTGKVWTNDDLGTAFPKITLLGKSENVISLGAFDATPMPVVRLMLRLAGVVPGEMVFDLGSGDGRIVVTAAEEFGARGVGIELDQELVARSQKAVAEKGLEDRVRIIHANVFDVDLSPADVVTLFISPASMKYLRPHLEKTLRPGTRVVSHQYEIKGWQPERVLDLDGFFIYLYRVD